MCENLNKAVYASNKKELYRIF